jgi:hypothetical protein
VAAADNEDFGTAGTLERFLHGTIVSPV